MRIINTRILGVGFVVIVLGIVTIGCSLINAVPYTCGKQVHIPASTDIVDETFTIPPGEYKYYSFYIDAAHIHLEVTDGAINFYLLVEEDFNNWKDGYLELNYPSSEISQTEISFFHYDWEDAYGWAGGSPPWCFVYDNSLGTSSRNVVTRIASIVSNQHSQKATDYRPIIPSSFLPIGMIMVLGGVAVSVGAIAIKEDKRVSMNIALGLLAGVILIFSGLILAGYSSNIELREVLLEKTCEVDANSYHYEAVYFSEPSDFELKFSVEDGPIRFRMSGDPAFEEKWQAGERYTDEYWPEQTLEESVWFWDPPGNKYYVFWNPEADQQNVDLRITRFWDAPDQLGLTAGLGLTVIGAGATCVTTGILAHRQRGLREESDD